MRQATAAILHEDVIFDRRGARALPADEERRERYRGVWHALTVRHLLTLKRHGRSSLGALEGRGGAPDPVAIDAAIATVSTWLADCTATERDALAIELLHPTLPIDHGHRPEPVNPRRRRRSVSRCDLLAARYPGERFYEARYHALVETAYRKVEARMTAAGVLSWDAR